MTARTPAQAAAAPAAMTAFLRGVERRAALFAALQCGDASVGDEALVAALQVFAAGARQWPVADWPRRFWSTLLAAPALRGAPAQSGWPAPFGSLAGLGRGPRAALLLRLVAGLAEPDAAAVLGIAEPTYRLALQRAAPRRADGSADADAWQALDQAAREALRQLPVPRMVQLTQMREAALTVRGRQAEIAAARGRRAPGSRAGRPCWLLPSLRAALALCVAAFAATFLWPDAWLPQRASSQRIELAALPSTDAPRANFDAATALLSHRDFELLLFAQTASATDQALLRDLEFYAWYAAGIAAQPASALPLPDAAQPLPDAPAGGQEVGNATP
ncbi:hypothetical protein MQC88_10965 [Luteimonas sp. 50]|uniref:DNA-directed RNA polymerase specialized sigma24 family protein n=1 Tax=Cognatiluteimonas sedimenti TaxID=2927791 RepID=A0ABT0A649_9GAMM|nr:hypothetical protein [Lysobacter sedimenti]MCJ0826464.1 hypothetical protein [Lysobacter sedimenti]